MIVAKKLKDNFNRINELLNDNNIKGDNDKNSIIYTLEEDNKVLGIAQARILNKNAFLDYIVIDKKFRGNRLGDGLLRSLLNYLYRHEVNYIYSNLNNYLVMEGFNTIEFDNVPIEIQKEISDLNAIVCNIKDFFNSGCSCKR